VTDHILVGHFLLRSEAAQRAGLSTAELVQRPDLLRIGGVWLEEVYFEFQFDEYGIRENLGSVVRELRRSFSDLTIAEWLAIPNEVLAGATPLRRAATGTGTALLSRAATEQGPNGGSPSESSR
jgi:hypothetical protein